MIPREISLPRAIAGVYLLTGDFPKSLSQKSAGYYIGQSNDILQRSYAHRSWVDSIRMILLWEESNEIARRISERRFQAAALSLGLLLANGMLPKASSFEPERSILEQALTLTHADCMAAVR